MFKLKFGYMPGHWGLTGKTREIAQAEYELVGYDLEKRLLEIKKDDFSGRDYATRLIDLEFKYGKIDKFTHLRRLADLIQDELQRASAMLEIDLKEGKITQLQYDKQYATLNNEPWVHVLEMNYGGLKSLEGSFELDWNEMFVAKLEKDGYQGPTPDSIVNQWFMEICRNVALEEFDGTGDFTADSEANLETMKRWNSSESLDQGRRGYK